jgi:hypothetical protein
MGKVWSQIDMAHLLADTMDNISSHVKVADLFRPTTLVILTMAFYGAGIVRRLFKLRAALTGIGNLPGRSYRFWTIYAIGQRSSSNTVHQSPSRLAAQREVQP